eukprot:2035940-Rhodomonas_salina.1
MLAPWLHVKEPAGLGLLSREDAHKEAVKNLQKSKVGLARGRTPPPRLSLSLSLSLLSPSLPPSLSPALSPRPYAPLLLARSLARFAVVRRADAWRVQLPFKVQGGITVKELGCLL